MARRRAVTVTAASLLAGLVLVMAPWPRTRAPSPLPDVARPILFAHRGGGGEAPESTVLAVQAAIAQVPDVAIELDVRCSRDGHPVVIHDATVDRTTDGTGQVADLSLARMQTLDAGFCATPGVGKGTAPRGQCHGVDARQFPFRGQGHRIPTLKEALAVVPPGTLIGIEVKVEGCEAALADLLRAAGRDRNIVVGSANVAIARRLQELLPHVAHYFPFFAASRFAAAAKLTGGTWAFPAYHVFAAPRAVAGIALDTPRLIEAARARGVLVAYFTVNEEAAMERLMGLGADGIFTDFPSRAARVRDRLRASGWTPATR